MQKSLLIALAMAIASGLAGCAKRNTGALPANARYVVGPAYQAGGEWRYPRSFDQYDHTGLAMVIPGGHAGVTTDGERFDQGSLTAQSPVLPLPSLVRVTNLVNGRSLVVRVNDRGPQVPGRIIAVTRKVASKLHFPRGGIVEVRVRLLSGRSDALQQALGAGPQLTAAPVASVQATPLAPPSGVSGVAGPSAKMPKTPAAAASAAGHPWRLSGKVTMERPAPGPLFVEIPGFGSSGAAWTLLNRRLSGMPGRVVPQPRVNRTLYAVRLGPYRSVDAADRSLHEILRRGVTNPEIVVH